MKKKKPDECPAGGKIAVISVTIVGRLLLGLGEDARLRTLSDGAVWIHPNWLAAVVAVYAHAFFKLLLGTGASGLGKPLEQFIAKLDCIRHDFLLWCRYVLLGILR